MTESETAILRAELSEVDMALSQPAMAESFVRYNDPRSMARLTAANIAAFDAHVSALHDHDFAAAVIADPRAAEHAAFIERVQHLAANYFLSAVPLLEHLRSHVSERYPDKEHRTRLQFDAGLGVAVNRYDGHLVIVELRNMVAHRQLPTVRIAASSNEGEPAAPIIDRREMLRSPRCGSKVRRELEMLDIDDLPLDRLVLDDGTFVLEFADWFLHIEALHNADEFLPMARLLERRERLIERLSETSGSSRSLS